MFSTHTARLKSSVSKWPAIILFVLISSLSFASEVQHHGLWFEGWLCDTFFSGYRPTNYTQKWDIPASVNANHGGLPVNPKAVKLGSPLGLGDAIRQFEIGVGNESFILIAGFWTQTDLKTKTWVNVQAVTISPEQWRRLWHPVTRADLERLDAVVKDASLSLEATRRLVQGIKSRPPFSDAIIQVNPKIDRNQRRLQCSLGFNAFFDNLLPGISREAQQNPTIWGKPIPEIDNASARMLGK